MLKFLSPMLCTSKIHPFSLGNYLGTSLIIGNSLRIKVTSVEWKRLGLEWISDLELSTDELLDATLGTNYAQDFDLNFDLNSVDVDDAAPPTI